MSRYKDYDRKPKRSSYDDDQRADDRVARAMVDVAVRRTSESGSVILENHDIRAMVRSVHRPSRDR